MLTQRGVVWGRDNSYHLVKTPVNFVVRSHPQLNLHAIERKEAACSIWSGTHSGTRACPPARQRTPHSGPLAWWWEGSGRFQRDESARCHYFRPWRDHVPLRCSRLSKAAVGHAGRFPQPALYDAVGRDSACEIGGHTYATVGELALFSS